MTKKIKISTAVVTRIVLDTDEYRALEAICAFLRVRTAGADAKERADGLQRRKLLRVQKNVHGNLWF